MKYVCCWWSGGRGQAWGKSGCCRDENLPSCGGGWGVLKHPETSERDHKVQSSVQRFNNFWTARYGITNRVPSDWENFFSRFCPGQNGISPGFDTGGGGRSWKIPFWSIECYSYMMRSYLRLRIFLKDYLFKCITISICMDPFLQNKIKNKVLITFSYRNRPSWKKGCIVGNILVENKILKQILQNRAVRENVNKTMCVERSSSF